MLFAALILTVIIIRIGAGHDNSIVDENNVITEVTEETEEQVSEEAADEPKEEPTVPEKEVSASTDDGVWVMGGPEEIPLNALEYHDTWNEMVEKGWVEKTLLGYPSKGRKEYPVYLYHLEPSSGYLDQHYDRAKGKLFERPKILITSGFHGSEKAAPSFLKNLVEDMMTDPDLAAIAAKYEWDIIPLVNPWGYSHSLLKNGVLQNGQVYDSLSGYKVVENGEYNQGVRLNADELDCNRDWHDGAGGCPSDEAKLVRDVLVNGNYDLVIDIHQTKNNTACGFISIGKRPDDMSRAEYEQNCIDIYTAALQAGIKTDRQISQYYKMDSIDQNAYPWDGTDEATFRNYAAGYTAGGKRKIDLKKSPKYSLCLEISMYCADISGKQADTSYNSIANTYGNTFIHNFAERIEDLV